MQLLITTEKQGRITLDWWALVGMPMFSWSLPYFVIKYCGYYLFRHNLLWLLFDGGHYSRVNVYETRHELVRCSLRLWESCWDVGMIRALPYRARTKLQASLPAVSLLWSGTYTVPFPNDFTSRLPSVSFSLKLSHLPVTSWWHHCILQNPPCT